MQTNEQPKLQLEQAAYETFLRAFYHGTRFAGQRFGQAFYNHFKLHKLANQDQLKGLYEADQKAAVLIIQRAFEMH